MLNLKVAAIFKQADNAKKFHNKLLVSPWSTRVVVAEIMIQGFFKQITESPLSINLSSPTDKLIEVKVPPTYLEKIKNIITEYNGEYVPEHEYSKMCSYLGFPI